MKWTPAERNLNAGGAARGFLIAALLTALWHPSAWVFLGAGVASTAEAFYWASKDNR